MLFRRSASLVDAVQVDGTEAALRAVLSLPRIVATTRAGELSVATSTGDRIARLGHWVAFDRATRAVRLYEDGAFQATHEAIH